MSFYLVDLTWGGELEEPLPRNCTHQAHKNGQYYDLKQSKILFNCK